MSNAWQYYILKIISQLLCLLPYASILALGKVLGRLYYHIAARQRRRALLQIQERLGISFSEAEDIIKRLFIKIAQTLLEVMYMPALTPEKMERYVTIENRHYLTEAVAKGRGVVYLSAHLGNWEWMGAALAMAGFPVASVIKSQPNAQHTRIINEYRQQAGITIFARGAELLSAAKALKQGKVLGFFSDQDAGIQGTFVNFLGKMASTPRGAAVFAKKFKSPIVPAFIVRRPQGGHSIMIDPPIYYEDTGDEKQDIHNLTVRLTGMIENKIKEYPDEWIWFQKRWNTPFADTENVAEKKGKTALADEESVGERA